MAISRPLGIAVLAGVAVLAHFTLGRQAGLNGSFTLDTVFEFKNRILHNTNIPIALPQTGIAPIDNYFAFMLNFFWAALDERNVAGHLQANYIVGTLSGAFFLMLSEAHRSSSSVGFMLGTYFCELMGEFFGIGMFTPVWCVIHLLSTRAPLSQGKQDGVETIATPPGTMRALGYALFIGHFIPTLLMKNCAIDGQGWKSAQLWTILRLFHPVFVLAAFTIFKSLPATSSVPVSSSGRVSHKRKLYLFAILASATGHINTLGVVPALREIPAWIIPNVAAITDGRRVDFATGVATFLQWDNICAASAIFIWAATLYLESSTKRSGKGLSLNVLLQAVGLTALAGPAAGAAFFLQERDDVLVEHYQTRAAVGQKK